MRRVFVKSLKDFDSISRSSHTKDSKMVLDPIYPTPPLGQDMTQGQIFKRSLTGFNSEFSFS